jgi:ElaB/YqjD/DUF883 family membrane-anchored ribosome-binding protein
MKNTIDGLTDKIEEVRQGAADSLESAADTVRAKAEHGLDAIDNMAQGAAQRLDATAKMVRDCSPAGSLRHFVRENPGAAVCVGVAVGLLAGLSLRRN